MSRASRRAAILAGAAALIGAGVAASSTRRGAAAPLPSGTLIAFDVVDADAPRDPPLLTLFEDGRLALREPSQRRPDPPPGRVREARLTPAGLSALLAYIVEQERLFDLDMAAIERAIAQATARPGLILAFADAPTTFLAARIGGRETALSLHASALLAYRLPQIAPLQRFRRIEVRLLELATGILQA